MRKNVMSAAFAQRSAPSTLHGCTICNGNFSVTAWWMGIVTKNEG